VYAHLIVKNDGVVVKWENMTYLEAVHMSGLMLDLHAKSEKSINVLFEYPDNNVQSIRLRAKDRTTGHQHEVISAQTDAFTMVFFQGTHDGKGEDAEGAAEGAEGAADGAAAAPAPA
jgi:hypothetical protein